MKALTNLKLCALALVLTAGMTSCLKTSDPDFMVVPDVYYLQQSGSGDNARYTPVVRIVGNYPISSAHGKFENDVVMFSAVPNTSNYYMEAIYVSSVDTVTSGIFTISATSAEESPRSASNQILFKVSKPLGDFEVEGELKYDDQTRVVTGTWSASENAEGYVLMYQAGSSNTFASLGELKTTNKDGKLEGTLTLPSGLSGTVRIAVAAVNGQVCLMKASRSITVGTN